MICKRLLLFVLIFLIACSGMVSPETVDVHRWYLPLVMDRQPKAVLSVYLERVDDNRLQWAKPGGIVGFGINRATHTWEQSDIVVARLEGAGFQYTIQIKNTLPEYRVRPDRECSPPKEAYYGEYAAFIIQVLDRYKPYSISIWNEPELTPGEVSPGVDHYIGCWGDYTKTYFGGEAYGRFLTAIYPLVKAAHPNMLIVGGELTLSLYSARDKRFAMGVAKYGKFDRLAFHAYPGWPYKDFSYPVRQAQFLAVYTDKPLELSETSYACDDAYHDCSDPVFEQYQAEYLKYMLAHALENNIVFLRWYTLANNGWRNTDMVYGYRPKPAHKVYMEF